MTEHACRQEKAIDMMLELAKGILSRVDDITGSLGTVKVHENEIDHLKREQRTLWKRQDELRELAAKAIETATAASTAASEASRAAAAAAEAASSAAAAVSAAQKRLDKLANTPARLLFKYAGHVILLLTAAYIGAKYTH